MVLFCSLWPQTSCPGPNSCVSEETATGVWWWRIVCHVWACSSSGWPQAVSGPLRNGARSAFAGSGRAFHWVRRFPKQASRRIGGIADSPVSFTELRGGGGGGRGAPPTGPAGGSRDPACRPVAPVHSRGRSAAAAADRDRERGEWKRRRRHRRLYSPGGVHLHCEILVSHQVPRAANKTPRIVCAIISHATYASVGRAPPATRRRPPLRHSALMKSRVRFQGICNKAEPYCCSTPLRSERDRK